MKILKISNPRISPQTPENRLHTYVLRGFLKAGKGIAPLKVGGVEFDFYF